MTQIYQEPTVPTGHSTKLITPNVGDTVTVTLPGEIMRAEVVRVIDPDHIVCKLQQPMAKSHSYQKGAEVTFQRAKGFMREHWVVES